MHYRNGIHSGTLHLETDHLLFRGDVRLKILFEEFASVEASAGLLKVRLEKEEAAFEIGAAAANWADKILNPPSRLTKLGVKRDRSVFLAGEMDAAFLAELDAAGVRFVKADPDLIFLAASTVAQLKAVAALSRRLAPGKAIWIIYPKGVSVVREADVRVAGRGAGLMDTKVAAFSKTHTALRFSKPA